MKDAEGFRENLALVLERTEGRMMIRIREAAEILGVDHRTLLRDTTLPKRRAGKNWIVSATALARWMK